MSALAELRAGVGAAPRVVATARVDETSVRRLCEVYGLTDLPAGAVPWTWLPYLVRPRPTALADTRPTPALAALGSVVNGGTRIVPCRPVHVGDELTLVEGLHEVDVKQRGGRALTIVTTRQTVQRGAQTCAHYYLTAIYRGEP